MFKSNHCYASAKCIIAAKCTENFFINYGTKIYIFMPAEYNNKARDILANFDLGNLMRSNVNEIYHPNKTRIVSTTDDNVINFQGFAGLMGRPGPRGNGLTSGPTIIRIDDENIKQIFLHKF